MILNQMKLIAVSNRHSHKALCCLERDYVVEWSLSEAPDLQSHRSVLPSSAYRVLVQIFSNVSNTVAVHWGEGRSEGFPNVSSK